MEFIGDFTGSTLVKDPVTGFLTSAKVLIKSNHAVDLDVKDSKDVKDFDVKDVKTLGVERDSRGRWLPGVCGVVTEPVFNSDKKLQFLALYSKKFPDFASCCLELGVSTWTYRNHLKADEAFRLAVEEVKTLGTCRIHTVRYEQALQPLGVMDRDRWLYGHMPEIYNPKQTIEVKHTMTHEQAQQSHSQMERAIDAEVIETVKRIKAGRKATARPQNPTA